MRYKRTRAVHAHDNRSGASQALQLGEQVFRGKGRDIIAVDAQDEITGTQSASVSGTMFDDLTMQYT